MAHFTAKNSTDDLNTYCTEKGEYTRIYSNVSVYGEVYVCEACNTPEPEEMFVTDEELDMLPTQLLH